MRERGEHCVITTPVRVNEIVFPIYRFILYLIVFKFLLEHYYLMIIWNSVAGQIEQFDGLDSAHGLLFDDYSSTPCN